MPRGALAASLALDTLWGAATCERTLGRVAIASGRASAGVDRLRRSAASIEGIGARVEVATTHADLVENSLATDCQEALKRLEDARVLLAGVDAAVYVERLDRFAARAEAVTAERSTRHAVGAVRQVAAPRRTFIASRGTRGEGVWEVAGRGPGRGLLCGSTSAFGKPPLRRRSARSRERRRHLLRPLAVARRVELGEAGPRSLDLGPGPHGIAADHDELGDRQPRDGELERARHVLEVRERLGEVALGASGVVPSGAHATERPQRDRHSPREADGTAQPERLLGGCEGAFLMTRPQKGLGQPSR